MALVPGNDQALGILKHLGIGGATTSGLSLSNNPKRVVAFNTAEGWARDVTEDVAREVMARSIKAERPLSDAVRSFVERETGDALPERTLCQVDAAPIW